MWSVIVRDENARCTDACWIIPFVICLGLFIFVCSDAGTSAVKLRSFAFQGQQILSASSWV